MGKKYYVVWEGRDPGVYDNWDDASEQVINFPGARYKSFPTQAAAVAAFRGSDSAELRTVLNMIRRPAVEFDYSRFPEIDRNGWAVDASCMGNPGVMEYRGVDLASGETLFHVGPFPKGTNNIGEYLAIVHALALMEQRGVRHTIYSDSRTAQGWVKARVCRTKLPIEPQTAKLHSLVERANTWLSTHAFRVPVVKWQTEVWGEIPADFGRK